MKKLKYYTLSFALIFSFSFSLSEQSIPPLLLGQQSREVASTLKDCTFLLKKYLSLTRIKEFYDHLNDDLHEPLKAEDRIKDIIYSNFIANPFYDRHIEKYTTDEGVMGYVRESGFSVPRSEEFLRKIDGLNAALKALPNKQVTVYSGRALDHETLKLHGQFDQDKLSFNYFISSSVNLSVALGFIDRSDMFYGHKKPYLLKINTKNGKVITQKSNYDEHEVLFPSTAIFRIKEKRIQQTRDVLPNFLAQDTHFLDQKLNIIELEEITPEISNFRFLDFFRTKTKRPFNPKVELKRLIDKNDFYNTTSSHTDDLYDHYGLEAAQSWLVAARFIQESFNQDVLNLEFLKKIHQQVMPADAYYSSFERRRVLRDYKNKKLSRTEAMDWLEKIEKKEAIYSGIDHRNLAGELRKDSIDYLVFEGEQKTRSGKRFFTGQELEGMMANPAFKREGPIKKKGKDQFFARFHLISPEHIDEIVHNLFGSARDALRKSKTDKEYIKNVVILEKMLIAIHPFLDGNGRTIRLLSDALYLKRNLPLPLHPRTDDFYRSSADLIEDTYALMQDYVNAYKKMP